MTDVPGLQTIDLDYVNAFILDTEHGRVLVDTGDPTHGERVLAAIGDTPIDLVILTHAHMDHLGGLQAVLAGTGAKLAAHTEEAKVLAEGRAGRPMVAAPFCPPHILEMVKGGPASIEPVQVDHAVGDGDAIPGFPDITAIHTPGHSAGHIALLWGRVLVAGDAAGNPGQVSPPPVAEDYELVAESLEKLSGLDFDVAVFGHGPAVTSDAPAAFRGIAPVVV